MKRSGTIVVVAALSIGLCAIPGMAQKKKQQKRTSEQTFARVDKNGDKKLSLEEFLGKRTEEKAAKAKDQFKRLDKDKDGFLTLDEYRAGRKKG